ncbi:MAG: DUF4129 domain-containing protein [Bifidobacteriaceae bacterium]|nr:DUF4129 domain-containing protein [Bifidobacteriaceae bacterium]
MTTALEPPLNPDRDEARRWLEEELSRSIYDENPSLWERFIAWLRDIFIEEATAGPASWWVAVAVGVLVLALAAAVAWFIARQRRIRGAKRAPGPVFADERRTADELRAAAQERARVGDWRSACILAFQALTRSFEEEAILDPQPGRTAREVAADAAQVLPSLSRQLYDAASQFDRIAYGHARGDAQVFASLTGLAERARATRPVEPPTVSEDAPALSGAPA